MVANLKPLTGLNPRCVRDKGLLDDASQFFEVVDEEPHFEVSRFIVRRTKNRRRMDRSHDVGSKS